jgi:hypothetical protein
MGRNGQRVNHLEVNAAKTCQRKVHLREKLRSPTVVEFVIGNRKTIYKRFHQDSSTATWQSSDKINAEYGQLAKSARR